MHLVYLDESGNTGTNLNDTEQPIFLLAALIVPEAVWQPLERDLEEAIGRHVPTMADGDEVHATDLRQDEERSKASLSTPASPYGMSGWGSRGSTT